jgi:long-chain acyl-CoA synthetase
VDAANARLPGYAQVHRWLRVTMPFTATNQLLTTNGRLRREVIERRYATQIADLYVDAIAS